MSNKILAKRCTLDQVQDTLKFEQVACRLGIRVPRVHRTACAGTTEFIIMDRIEGTTFEEIWPNLS